MRQVTIIGAGASGCAAARRLSDDPDVTVTLLEAGSPTGRPDVETPPAWPSLLGSDLDWATMSIPQEGAGRREFMFSRGRGLGGSTAVNAMIHSHPDAATLEQWPPTMSADNFARLIPVLEAHIGERSGAGTARGEHGLVTNRQAIEPNAVSTAFIEASRTAGYPELGDPNAPGARGAGLFDLSIDSAGRRVDAYTAYLAPVIDRDNLEVRTGVEVTRLQIHGGKVIALDVLCDGVPDTMPLAGEVLLCAGAIATPVLLLRSGVGPVADLTAAGLEVVVDNPNVGQNLHDHPMIPIVWSSGRAIGPPTNQLFEALLYLPDEPSADGHTLSAAIGHIPLPLPGLPSPEFGITALVGTYTPRSRGTVTLDPANPAGDPLIDPRYMTDQSDVNALVRGLGLIREVFAQQTLAAFGLEELFPGSEAVDNDQLAAAVRLAISSYYHPVGTCRAGTDDESVVDETMRVRGLTNVRVGDMSIAPITPRVATSVTAQYVGWRTAELLLEDDTAAHEITTASTLVDSGA